MKVTQWFVCACTEFYWGCNANSFASSGVRRGWVISTTLRPLYTLKRPSYPLLRTSGGPWSRCGGARKMTPPPGIDPRTLQPIICYLMRICCTMWALLFFTLDAGLLARSQYSEGPATGHLDTGFSWFPCVYKQMLR